MGVKHKSAPIEGVQFHPESVLTEGGHRLLANWLETCGDKDAISVSLSFRSLASLNRCGTSPSSFLFLPGRAHSIRVDCCGPVYRAALPVPSQDGIGVTSYAAVRACSSVG